jgi:uncharacterized protein (DUF983 family)
MSRLPTGCDQQGRYPEAAEAATEIGADDFDDAAAIIVKQIICIVIVIAVMAAIFAFQ